MKKLYIISAFVILSAFGLTTDSWATNKYARTVGGNWTADATWSTTSGGAADTVAPTASDDVFLDANSGQVTISATSVGKSLTCTGYTGTLTHNAFNLTISGSVTLVSGMTYTPSGTSSILRISSNGTLTTGGKLLWVFIQQSAAVVTLGDNLNFVAQKTARYGISSGSLALNGFTLSGNSSINRVLVQSETLGTATNITNTTGTFANADFRDITFSSAADYSAITGLSGDCGGNTNATFTTAATQTYTGGTGSWSNSANWTSRVPLPQDDVLMSGVTGGTITADMPRLGKSIDWTGASGTPTFAMNSTTNTVYRSLTLISSMTLTSSQQISIESSSRSTGTPGILTSAGKVFGAKVEFGAHNSAVYLADALSTTGSLNVVAGTFDTSGYNISSATGRLEAGTITVNVNSSTWTVTSTGASTWSASNASLTFNCGTSTIVMSDITASSKTFAGGGKTYNNLQIAGGGAGAVIITGANTFNRIYTDGGGTKTITFPASTTTTLLNQQLGFANGSYVLTLNSSSAGTTSTLSQTSGVISNNYLLITDITATGGASWYAGDNSKTGGDTATASVVDKGWIFTNPGADKSLPTIMNYPGLTFYKKYSNTSSTAADYSSGTETGTWTVTRSASTPATYVDASGIIQLKTDTTPRFTQGFYNSTGFVSRPGLIVEGAGTNLLKDSYFTDGTTTYWQNTGGTLTTSNTYTNIFGGGQVLKFVGTTTEHRLYGTNPGSLFSVTSGSVYTMSVYIRGTGNIGLRFYGTAAIDSAPIALTNNGWYKITQTFTATATGNGNVGIFCTDIVGATFYISAIQFEASPFATTFIPTTTAALTRNAETLTYPISGNRTAASESIFMKFTAPYNGSQLTSNLSLGETSTKQRDFLLTSSQDDFVFRPNATDSGTATIRTGAGLNVAAGTSYVMAGIAISPTGNPNHALYVNGTSYDSTTNLNTDWTSPSWGTNFYIGSDSAGATHANVIISSIAIFSDAKSAGDVLRITNELNRTYYGNAFERGSFILGDMDVRDVYDGMR